LKLIDEINKNASSRTWGGEEHFGQF